MPLDPTQIRVGLTGHLYKAVTGSTAPVDSHSTALAAAWKELGYVDPTALNIAPTQASKDLFGWQSLDPLRTIPGQRGFITKFKLMQRNTDTITLALGGGTIVAGTGSGEWVYTPPASGTVTEWSFVWEITDGTVHDRYYLPRGTLDAIGAFNVINNDATMYDCSVKALVPSGGGSPWKLLSDDVNFSATP